MSIRLSPKHGVNPSIAVCFFCLKDKNEVVLPGMLKGDQAAPHRAVWNKEPCDQCKAYMEKGIILISVQELMGSAMNDPHRTGGWCVVKEEAVKRMLKPGHLLDHVLKARVAFLPDVVWNQVGLPR